MNEPITSLPWPEPPKHLGRMLFSNLERDFRNLLSGFNELEDTRNDIINYNRDKLVLAHDRAELARYAENITRLVNKQKNEDRATEILSAMLGFFTEEGTTREDNELLREIGFDLSDIK